MEMKQKSKQFSPRSKKLQMENSLYKCVGILRLVVFKN